MQREVKNMVDPMQMKALAIRQAIKDLKTDDRKLRVKALKALGVVLTVSEDPNSEKQVLKAIHSALDDDDKAVRKAAKTALEDTRVQEKDMNYLLELSRKALDKSKNKQR